MVRNVFLGKRWFGIYGDMMVWDQDGLTNTPKTFGDFFQRVLNVLLTKLEWFGIMQRPSGPKSDPHLGGPNLGFITLLPLVGYQDFQTLYPQLLD